MSSFHEDALNEIKKNRERKLTGGYNSIPFGHKRLQHYIPGVQHSNIVIVTANSGIGKSKLTKNMFVFRPFDFVYNNPHLNIKFDTLYFCLEEPGKAFMQSLMTYRLRKEFNERQSIKELRSQLDPDDKSKVVTEETITKLEGMRDYMHAFENSVHLIDDARKPYAIFMRAKEFLEEVGDYTHKPANVWNPQTKTYVKKIVKDRYITEHEDHYVQIIIDHVSLLEPEKNQDLFEAIRMLSNTYMVQLRNRYHCSIVMVQQQASDKEKQQYTYKGTSIESKLEPSLDGLGDCKLTQRDADEVLGVFAPDRYEIADHRGYDIAKLRDNYRSLSVLKSRDGEANLRLGFLFDGATNYLAELPPAKEMTSAHYRKALETVGREGSLATAKKGINFKGV